MVDNASALAMRKEPYLIYPGNNAQMTVLWQLDSTSSCTLEWGLNTSYSTGSTNTTQYGDYQHKYTITNLTPGTKYFYRVTAGAIQKTGSFVTAPATNATNAKFMVYGDTRNGAANQDAVNARMIAEYTVDPAYQSITLFSGDWVDRGRTEINWTTEWFNLAQPNMMTFRANVPINGAVGNHEIAIGATDDGDLFKKYFPFPMVSNNYWSFDYGPTHIAVVDQYTDGLAGTISAAQLTWLESDLAASVKEWKFIVLHAPGWTGSTRINAQVQTAIQPLCETYGVAMVLGGHEHFYTRCGVNGVKHITTGGGGAPLDVPGRNYPYVEEIGNGYHYCAVDIVGSTLYFKAVASDGTVLDTFNIVHGPPDITPPTPNPMTWATAPHAVSSVSVAMTATTATDESGVEYYFDCTAGVGGHDSGWQSSSSYTDTGLTPLTQYTYQVKARDRSPTQNETALSTPASATTTAMQIPGKATNPNPANSATGVDIFSVLSWTGHPEATSHDVYFGTSSPPPFIQNQAGTAYDPGGMLGQTVYYWRINEKNAVGTTTGDLWSFTTGTADLFSDYFPTYGDFTTGGWTTGGYSTNVNNQCMCEGENGAQMKQASWIEKALSTVGYTNITVSYYRKTSGMDAGEYLYSEWYDGTNWNNFESTQVTACGQVNQTCGSGADNNPNFKIRFSTNGSASNEYGCIDGVVVSGMFGEPPDDTTAPTPNPMTWASVPAATGSTTIAMTATTGSDATGPVQYFFQNTTSGMSSHNSGWQTSTSWTDTGLTASTTYSYQVQARDSVSPTPNVGNWSTTQNATTQADSSTLFGDGFESGNFTVGGWTTQNANATVSTKAKLTGAYGAKLAGTTWMQKAISTVGKSTIHVKYARKTAGLDAGENLYVEWSIDGSAWNNLETTQATAWASQDITCGSGANNNANFRVRWRTNANSAANEYAYVDDVVITGQ